MLNPEFGPYLSHFKDVFALPRENLTALAVYLHENGFKKLKNDPLEPRRGPFGLFGKKPFHPTPEEALEIYHQNKKERYALTAVLIKRVVERAYSERPNRGRYGLIGHPLKIGTQIEDPEQALQPITWLALPDPFRALDTYMQTTLRVAHAEEMDFLEEYSQERPKDKLSRNFRRLKKWEAFYHDFLPKTEDGVIDLGEDYGVTFNPVFTESPTGTETVARVMASTLRLIPQICERDVPFSDLNPQYLVQTARNSTPFIARMAMLPFDAIGDLLNVVTDEINKQKLFLRGVNTHNYIRGYLDPDYFISVPVSTGIKIDFAQNVWDEVEKYMSFSRGSGQKFTLGCPAVPKIDGASSVKLMWDWNLDIAEQIYTDYWSSLFEPAASKEAAFQARKAEAESRGLLVAGIHF